jgi:hypothetical protein
MVNPSPTHTEINGDIVTHRGLETDQIPKVTTDVITHGMNLARRANPNEHQVENTTTDAKVRPIYSALVTEENNAGNGQTTVHCIKKGRILKQTKSILKKGDKVQVHGASTNAVMLWAGAAGADVGTYEGHLNEGDRKYPYTNAAVDDIVIIDWYGGVAPGDAVT